VSRLRHTARVAAGLLGFVTTLAVAFFIGSYLGDGSHTGTAGSGGNGTKTVPVKVNFPSGQLTPQTPVDVTAEVENATSKAVTFTKIKPTISTGAAGCDASWFKVIVEGGGKATQWAEAFAGTAAPPVALTYAAGATTPVLRSSESKLKLVLEETGTDQSACEGAPVTLRFQLS
jgi:hypothetical protein